MPDQLTQAAILFTAAGTAAGIGLRTLWESYIKHRDQTRFEAWKLRVSQMERRLSQFYWPIYIRLQRDNVVWQKILDAKSPDEDKRKIAIEIEKNVILPNHIEVVKIIHSHIHLANPSPGLEAELLAYLRHVDVYSSMRAAHITDKDPIDVGEPWPTGLFAAIEEHLKRYQTEYDTLLRDDTIASLLAPRGQRLVRRFFRRLPVPWGKMFEEIGPAPKS